MPIGLSWISLDSLDRIETYQWVTGDFQLAIFRWALAAPGGEKSEVLTCGGAELFMEASLTLFLIFCKKISALIAITVDGPASAVMAGFCRRPAPPSIHRSGDSFIFNRLNWIYWI
jgi:hypothetical protein